jgi:catechol 2,3-dioxygenase-like lactoylglutathione lyase family enzyme
MALSLNHYSIRSFDLPACQHFYCDVLGLQVGPRPPFEFPGLWLYAGDLNNFANAVVHIIGFDRNDPDGLTNVTTPLRRARVWSITWPFLRRVWPRPWRVCKRTKSPAENARCRCSICTRCLWTTPMVWWWN